MSHVDEGALHSYLDGELPPAERAALEAHVAECAACHGRLAEERALVARASELLGRAQPPERVAPPLHQLRKSRVWWQMKVPLAWAASVVLALSIGYYAGSFRDRAAPVDRLVDSNVIAAITPADGPAAAAPRPTTRRAAEQPATPHEEVANAGANRAQTDSPPLAAGNVAMAPAPVPASQLRSTTPTPVPSIALRAASAEADLAAHRGRPVTTEWPIIRREPARAILGTDPVGVPGLAVREIRRSPTGDGTVLVEQQLDSSTVIQLFQRPATAERAEARAPYAFDRAAPAAAKEHAAADRLARFVGRLRVEIAGPLTQDSLNRLLEQVKPLP